jgi:very-short-patch-repair endonuclease
MVLSAWYSQIATLTAPKFSILSKILDDSIAQSYIESMPEIVAVLNSLEASVSELTSLKSEGLKTDDLQAKEANLHSLLDSLSRFNEWPPVRVALEALKHKLGDAFEALVYEGKLQPSEIIPTVQITIYEQIWQEMVNRAPELATLDGYQLESVLEKFRLLDKERMTIASNEVMSSYIANRPGGFAGDMGLIRQELNKKRNHMPVRKLVAKAGRAIQELKPVFLMSPMSVAQFIQPGAMQFDLVLIDEASQIRPEDAIGAIARSKQVVVVGDDKQLPPTSFFTGISDDETTVDEDDDGVVLSNLESILSLCNIVLPNQCMLRWHYRSHHPGLIAVSNRNFYDNNLLLPPSTIRDSYSDGMGVSMVKTPQNGYQRGGANGGRNVVEAEMIANAVIEFARNHPDKSLGVAAFSVKQRDAIRDLVDNKRRKHPELEEFFSLARDEYFFIKNLESIQGDQRDVIFISVGYGRDTTGRLTQTFGPLAQEGGERRLNVLISRAKDRCTVFSSITADDVRADPGKLGINAFREFLQYAEKGYFDVPTLTGGDFDSDFEESVAMFLRKNGYQFQPQIGMAGFYIDIGVIDPKNETRFICGIECDGATYHSSRSARDRDRLRQEILESRGWNIYRIWSTDWFHRRSEQEAKLLDHLFKLISGTRPSKIEVEHTPLSEVATHEEMTTSTLDSPCVPYIEYAERYVSQKMPHEIPSREMAKLVVAIVNLEGPIHQEEVGRRVSKLFGLERCGSRIQESVLLGLKVSGLKHEGHFWFQTVSSEKIRNRKDVLSKTLLAANNLLPMEIEQALLFLVRQNVRVSEDELIQQTSRLLGFNRCGPDLRTVITDALHNRAQKHLVANADGGYSIKG